MLVCKLFTHSRMRIYLLLYLDQIDYYPCKIDVTHNLFKNKEMNNEMNINFYWMLQIITGLVPQYSIFSTSFKSRLFCFVLRYQAMSFKWAEGQYFTSDVLIIQTLTNQYLQFSQREKQTRGSYWLTIT